ncbi:MAG: hypoxanthine phosphoribosyltransferase [Desulfovibrionaceae bacterium]
MADWQRDDMVMEGYTLREVLSSEAIRMRTETLANSINAHYGDEPVVAVCVLKGGFLFFADLVRRFKVSPEIDFIRLSSYGAGTSSSGSVRIHRELETPLANRHVLIVEDIVDTGRSMRELVRVFSEMGAKSLKICALVDKHERREVDLTVDFPGFTLKKGFIVGYGMDYAEKFRHLDAIYEIVGGIE